MRHLVVGGPLASERNDVLSEAGAQLLTRPRPRSLPEHTMRDSHHSGIDDVGMSEQDGLDLGR
jgi:hypothetical protein